MSRWRTYQTLFERAEMRIAAWMEFHGYTLLRVAMGIIFIWFGALKPLGMSPAAELVARTTWWIPIPGFINVLGVWEIAIGVCFLFERTNRWALILLFMHMPGTMLPLVMLPDAAYIQAPFALTLEGQYIIKNLVLISAAIVLGGKLRHRMGNRMADAPQAFHTLLRQGRWGRAEAGEVLVKEGEFPGRVLFIRSGAGIVRIDDKQVGRYGPEQFIGEMSFLTEGAASATVLATAPTEFIAWDSKNLRNIIEERKTLEQALHQAVNIDLVGKIHDANQPLSRESRPQPS